MKLLLPEWEFTLAPGEGRVPILSVENETCLYETFCALQEVSEMGGGRFVLTKNGKALDMKKSFLLIGSPAELDPNDRKLLTVLYKKLRDIAYDETHSADTTALCQNLIRYAEAMTLDHPLPLGYELDIDVADILKALHIQIDTEGQSLPEKMLTFMKSWVSLCGDTCFCFNHFRNFLPSDVREEFYRNAAEENFSFFLLEGICHDIMKSEELFVIDRDLCQIF